VESMALSVSVPIDRLDDVKNRPGNESLDLQTFFTVLDAGTQCIFDSDALGIICRDDAKRL